MTTPTTAADRRSLSINQFAALSGLACLFWAFIAWLTVIPNQDILADAVQVQTLITEPRIVLSFPGQKHAGTIEYPFQLLAEIIAPGNFYLHTFARVLFAFFTGFFTAKLFSELFPRARKWAFLTAIAIGPAIIHGLSGPEGNSVGVWWLVGNYSTSWLLVVAGALVFARGVSRESLVIQIVSGLLIGLGFYAHPNVIILIIPLGTLTILILRPRVTGLALLVSGFLIGIIPSLVSYFFFTGNNTWDPSRVPFFVRDFYLNALGLNGIPDYISVVLPYALGFPSSQTLMSGQVQSAITWVFVVVITFTMITGWFLSLRKRVWPQPIVLLATAWFAGVVGILIFVTFVDTVWFYATSLSILFWITLGALPSVVKPESFANALTVVVLIFTAISMLSHNWAYITQFTSNFDAKRQYQSEIRRTAQDLSNAGVQVIFGSYLDVIPIAYGSSAQLRPLSVRYNRFPLSEQQSQRNYVVAVKSTPTDPWGQEGLAIAMDGCAKQGNLKSVSTDYQIFECQGSVINQLR